MNILFSIGFVSSPVNKEVTVSILTTDADFQKYVDKFDKQELGMDIMRAIQVQTSKIIKAEEEAQSRIIQP